MTGQANDLYRDVFTTNHSTSCQDRIENKHPFENNQSRPRNTSSGSIDSELLGNREGDSEFSTPALESYSKFSACAWNMAYPLFGYASMVSRVAGLCFIGLTGFSAHNVDLTKMLCAWAIQSVLLSYTLSDLSTFAEKVIPLREQNALNYARINRNKKKIRPSSPLVIETNPMNRQNDDCSDEGKNDLSVDLELGEGALKQDHFNPLQINHTKQIHDQNDGIQPESVQPNRVDLNQSRRDQTDPNQAANKQTEKKQTCLNYLERYYFFCAAFRNITWDHIGVYSILGQSICNCFVLWSIIYADRIHDLLKIAIFLDIASTASQSYAKNSAHATKKLEERALELRSKNEQKSMSSVALSFTPHDRI